MEKWKEISEYYLVSNLGKIKSLPRNGTIKVERILKAKTARTGYKEVSLAYRDTRKSKLVHRLVAEAFIPNPENKPCIDHLDFDKSNNCVENLKWVSYEENNKSRYDAGRANQYTLYGQKNKPK